MHIDAEVNLLTSSLSGQASGHPDQDNRSLYDRDFVAWIQCTVEKLQNKQLDDLDLEHLIEELGSMGKREKRAVRNNLVIVLLHLLKWKYQPHKQSKSWKSSIVEHRMRLRDAFQDSPSLKIYVRDVFPQCYQDARDRAAIETGLNISLFPLHCPFTLEESLEAHFFP